MVFIDLNSNFHSGRISQGRGIGQRQISYLIQGIRGIRNHFPEEYLFLSVEGVDENVHESKIKGKLPLIIGVEYVGLGFGGSRADFSEDYEKEKDERVDLNSLHKYF